MKESDPKAHARSSLTEGEKFTYKETLVKRGDGTQGVGRGWKRDALFVFLFNGAIVSRISSSLRAMRRQRESRGVRAYISAYSLATFICRARFRLFLCPISPILPPSSRIDFRATLRRDIGYRAPRSVNKRDI